MRTVLRHHQKAQVFAIFPAVVLFMIGSIAIAIDVVLFNLVRSELQNATDAAALAAVRYAPACPEIDVRCLHLSTQPQTASFPASDGICSIAPDPPAYESSCTVALQYFNYNARLASALCLPKPYPVINVGSLSASHRNAVTVAASCDAWYLTGRVLGLTTPIRLEATSTAGLFENERLVSPSSIRQYNIVSLVDPTLYPLLAARLTS